MSHTVSEYHTLSHSQTSHQELGRWNKNIHHRNVVIRRQYTWSDITVSQVCPLWVFHFPMTTLLADRAFHVYIRISEPQQYYPPCWSCSMGYGALSITATHSIDVCGIPHQPWQSKMSPYIAKCPQGGEGNYKRTTDLIDAESFNLQ